MIDALNKIIHIYFLAEFRPNLILVTLLQFLIVVCQLVKNFGELKLFAFYICFLIWATTIFNTFKEALIKII